MTYCVGINIKEGMVFASDARTNAGLDNVNSYSKMLNYSVGDRNIVIVTAGNLATSQAVFSSVRKDLESKDINDMFLSGKSVGEIVEYINTHTFSGMEAKLKFATWRKI